MASFTEQQNLKTYLNEIDRRRNTNWRETFPWLTGVLDNVVFVIERYMYYINSLMDTAKLTQAPKIELN